MSRIDEMAKWHAKIEQHAYSDTVRVVTFIDRLSRKDFLAGARAVLEEARKMAHKPDADSVTQWQPFVTLAQMESLFTDTEDHEQR